MKLTTPKTTGQYFKKTEHAVKWAYGGLVSCWQHVEEAYLLEAERRKLNPPVLKDGMLHYLPAQTPEERTALDKMLASCEKYFELKMSEAMFAGAILESAYIAIRLYSPPKPIPASCAIFQLPNKAGQFCIGKERHGLPTGLIIYAGRNQYAHWDDDEPHEHTQNLFAALNDAFADNPFSDLAFDLGNPTIPVYASEILLTALRWTTYERYLADMKELLRA